MTREQAFAEAQRRFGSKAIVGHNEQYQDAPLFVGVKERGSFTKFGAGTTWEEALSKVVDVIDLGSGKFTRKGT